MVVANCLHATLDLSLPIQLRSRHPLVELELFHQDLSRRRLTYFLYLHRVLNHHRANMHIQSVPFLRFTFNFSNFQTRNFNILNLRTVLERNKDKRKEARAVSLIRNLHDCAASPSARARWSRDVRVLVPACPEFGTPIAAHAPTFPGVHERLAPPESRP